MRIGILAALGLLALGVPAIASASNSGNPAAPGLSAAAPIPSARIGQAPAAIPVVSPAVADTSPAENAAPHEASHSRSQEERQRVMMFLLLPNGVDRNLFLFSR